ncbi:MAG: pyrroloquinoline quinone biosynthesis protein PqqB [Pseudomonadota bacterium]
MKAVVLGAAAGGGLPQWNCGCQNCNDARNGKLPLMTQSSVAISVDDESWVLLNASPDIGVQLIRTPALHPRALRQTPIHSVVLTNGDIDHVAGLLTLREKTAFKLCATQIGLDILDSNAVFGVLDPDLVSRETLALDAPLELMPDLTIVAFSVPGKVALYLEGDDDLDLKAMGEQTIGLILQSKAGRLAYIPGCADIPDWLVDRIADVDVLLFDGTVWHDDDMPRTGAGKKTGARMGHISINGPDGSLARFASVKSRKILIHINNTNPILQPSSPERQVVERAGWEVAYDGMEIGL